MRIASSGAHDFLAEGGVSALGSVASFGWIAAQAANKPANPASGALTSGALSCAVRIDFDGSEAMDQSNSSGRASAVSGPRTATMTDQGLDPAICAFLQSDRAGSGNGWRYVRKTGLEL